MIRRTAPRGVAAVVQLDRVAPGKHLHRIGEIQTPFLKGLGTLGWVEGDIHGFNVGTRCLAANIRSYDK